ncbi:MAG TPA: transporter substrate-binding domain-containing protein [Burkholderiaceae bacterium]|nr:transporter substrate-binding domain-containing protein [Burkholderiaceae bacterium]
MHWILNSLFVLSIAFWSFDGFAQSQDVQRALAPSGKLRVGLLLGSPTQALRDASSGELRGVGHDLGQELALRLQVPFEPVLFQAIGPLVDAVKAGAVDVAFFGYSDERAKVMDYAPVHLEVEFGYLVPAGSSIMRSDEVDRPGIRVATQEKSLPDAFLARSLKNAQLVRAPTNAAALELVREGKADAAFSIKPNLFDLSKRLPGSRVLDDRPGIDPHAMAMPKGRDAGLDFARKFIIEAKSSGTVMKAIERAGLRGVSVATAP